MVTVAGARGGVGKSTIAANLAIEIARTTRAAVNVADLDLLFGSVAMMLDTLSEIGLQEWKRDRVRHSSTAVSPYLTETKSGVRLLAAPTDPDASLELSASDVSDLISDLSSTYDYVVVDTALGYTEVTAAALERATLPLLVTTPEISSLRATRFVVNDLRSRGATSERLAVVVNYSRAFVGSKELAETPGASVSWEIRHDVQVLRAAKAGVPVSTEKAGALIPRVLHEIAAEVSGVVASQGSRRWLLRAG
ncbi:MAG: hypothetical protein EXR66_01625 [Dehalococcoidia bacterium]|nr:hypothetical protein [Dehalococcoidia bacterium]